MWPSKPFRSFSYKGNWYETRLLAAYQPRNAAVAIDAANVLARSHPELGISQRAVERGIAHATWPGRFEVVSTEPLVVVDGAHNPDGAQALAESVRELLGAEGRKATLVVGVLADKDHAGILRPMLPFARRVVAYAPDNPRALAAQVLAGEAASMLDVLGLDVPVDVAPSAADAVALAVQKEGPEGFVVAFGTLYSIGAIKQALR